MTMAEFNPSSNWIGVKNGENRNVRGQRKSKSNKTAAFWCVIYGCVVEKLKFP
jgi:hypothetical protein